MVIYIVIVSIVFQFVTALLALRLIRITGKQLAWVFIAIAMILMASRRIYILNGIISGQINSNDFATSEWIGLLNSIFLFAGVAGFDKIFKKNRKNCQRLGAYSRKEFGTGCFTGFGT